jgi:hypothetical protein
LADLPVVLASSVIRSTHRGQSHGGVYLVDLETRRVEERINWNDGSISWEGRGGDRGLRGIAYRNDEILLAASDEIFVYNKDFRRLRSYRNRYLRHCHEIAGDGDRLYLTSTGFDSILVLDLAGGDFVVGYCLRHRSDIIRRGVKKLGIRSVPGLTVFDPRSDEGPAPGDTCHINNVEVRSGDVYVSGTGLGHLLRISDSTVTTHAVVPFGTHNCAPLGDGVVFNHTADNMVVYADRRGARRATFAIPQYSEAELHLRHLPQDHARQAFGRGLFVWDNLIVAGSSPATITVHDLDTGTTVTSVNLTMDVRNAIHGLQPWPFA